MMLRPPLGTHASISDFRASGWREAARSSGDSGYFSKKHSLCTAAVAATQAGEFAKARVLWLLGDACSLRIEASNLNEPLAQVSRQPGQRLALADFNDADLILFDAVCPELDDPLLRARVAEILWLRRTPRKLQDALAAIGAYRSTSLDHHAWFIDDTQNCWHRAITLALQIRAPGEALLAEMTAALLSAVKTEVDDGDAAPSMVEMLLDFGLAEAELTDLAERLVLRSKRLSSLEKGNRFFLARHYLALARRCFVAVDDLDRCADVDCLIAQAFADEAAARIAGEHPSHVAAASAYADAVQALLVIPRALRTARGVDQELERLRQSQREVAMRSTGDFAPLQAAAVDLKVICQEAREEVSGKVLTEALLAFAEIWPLASRKMTEETTRKQMQESFFSRQFGSQRLSSDGRVVAKSPLVRDFAQQSQESDEAVLDKMVQDHWFHIHYGVRSAIVPALRQLLLEHFIEKPDLVNIVGLSGMIPAERVQLIAKGLKAGFDGDFVVALHLLVPQLEHLVRTHLQNKGAKTVGTDPQGLQLELGLSSLVKLEQMEEVFGPDLAFEIRAVFCHGFGPNLRNELAHGLLSPDALRSAESIYGWWLIFSLIYQQYWYAGIS